MYDSYRPNITLITKDIEADMKTKGPDVAAAVFL